MTLKRKIPLVIVFAVATILVVAASVCFSDFAAYADTDTDMPELFGIDELKDIGYDLRGYDAEIGYYSQTLSNSGIYIAFEVTLDKDFLARAGAVEDCVYRYPQMFGELEKAFTAMGYTIDCDKNNGQLLASMTFESTTDYYIATGRNGYESNESSANVKKGFFYNDYYSSTVTAFSSVENEGNLLNLIYEKCLALGAEKEKIKLSYFYGTPYKIISTDADQVTYNRNKKLYVHRFDMTPSTKDREIHFTQHSPNSWAFYLIAVIVAVPVIAAPLAIAITKRKKKEGTNGR